MMRFSRMRKARGSLGWAIIGFAATAVALLAGQPTLRAEGEAPATVSAADFKYAPGKSRFEITLDREASFEKSTSDGDKQVILDIKNARLPKKLQRPFPTASYKSNVVLINPYQSSDRVRVAFQLAKPGSVEFTQEGNKLVALIDNLQEAEPAAEEKSAALTDADRQTPAPDAAANAAEAESPAPAAGSAATKENKAEESQTISMKGGETGSGRSSDLIDQFFEAQKNRKYVGRPISMQLKDMELFRAFDLIAETSELNIVLTDQVKGKITLNLEDVPWDQALDLILKSYRLAGEKSGNVLRVTTIAAMTAEKDAEIAARKAAEVAEPLVTKIFPISYATLQGIIPIIQTFMSTEIVGGGSGQAQQRLRGSITPDARTNSLVIRDTASVMEKIKRIIAELDTQTPQILIEAKIVAVDEQNNKEVHGRLFTSTREFTGSGGFVATQTRNNFSFDATGGATGLPGQPAATTGWAVTPALQGVGFGFSPKTNILPGLGEISAYIRILERQSFAKTVSSPRVIAQNKMQASITQGTKISQLTTAGVGAAGTTSVTNIPLTLQVTPTITNDGSVLLSVSLQKDNLSSASAAGTLVTTNRAIQTEVLVESGATLVIGGVYEEEQTEEQTGIPFLRELPIIGALFGSKSKTGTKNELFIFLSPRILNEKESGLRT